MKKALFASLLIVLAISGIAKEIGSEENVSKTLIISLYIINAKGEGIDVRVMADGEEIITVSIPYHGGFRMPEKGPAILHGPDARLQRNIRMKASTRVLRVIERNSGMEKIFSDIDKLQTGQGLTIEVEKDCIHLIEGINLPD